MITAITWIELIINILLALDDFIAMCELLLS